MWSLIMDIGLLSFTCLRASWARRPLAVARETLPPGAAIGLLNARRHRPQTSLRGDNPPSDAIAGSGADIRQSETIQNCLPFF
ncbi:hypothetical protein ACERNI_07160 [Camelimonas sp. ID_303_24]